MESAYFDRIGDHEKAVLLVEGIMKTITLPLSTLPNGSKPGQWFLIHLEQDQITSIHFDEHKTKQMTDTIQEQFTRLQSKKISRFKRQ